ncbi:MAG: RagB/SusD family nutrient uptake outer membrane protein [Paludibacter sp.]
MKNKKLYSIVVSGILLLNFFGCQSNFLDTGYDTMQTPQIIATNRSTLFLFANQFYANLQQSGFSIIDNNLLAAASDEAQQVASSSSAQTFNNGMITSYNNPLSGYYKNYYDGIRAVHFFLDYSKNYRQFLALNRDTIFESDQYQLDIKNIKWYRAEAHIAQAYYYMELIKLYGGVPLVNGLLEQTSNLYIPKSPYDSVVNFIVSEIDTYKKDLQVNWKTDTQFAASDGRFSLGSALAIKTRVLLYAASPLHNPNNDVVKWQRAASAANDLINTSGLNLFLATSYANYFIGNNPLTSTETILAIRSSANNTIEKQNYPIATPGGSTGECPTENLVSQYEYVGIPYAANRYANRDPRFAASIVYNGSVWNSRVINQLPGGTDDLTKSKASPTGYYLKKFLTDNLNLTASTPGTAQHQWVVFRYAEILLDYAEAMNEAYGPDYAPTGYTMNARQALIKVRARASNSLPAITTTAVSDFRNAVKHERMIELAFEGHRYWDLLRWKDAETVLNKPVQGVQISGLSTAPIYTVVDVAKRVFNAQANYYFPFQYSEIVNSKGTLIQNPGY